MSSLFSIALAYLSKICGLDSISAFPSGHPFSRTHWNPAYFDIPYGMNPDRIERALCAAIGNTPGIFTHIANPTPRMQRSLLAVIGESVRSRDGQAGDLVNLLLAAYPGAYFQEAVPGLRATMAATDGIENGERVRLILSFLSNMPAPFDVVDENSA